MVHLTQRSIFVVVMFIFLKYNGTLVFKLLWTFMCRLKPSRSVEKLNCDHVKATINMVISNEIRYKK